MKNKTQARPRGIKKEREQAARRAEPCWTDRWNWNERASVKLDSRTLIPLKDHENISFKFKLVLWFVRPRTKICARNHSLIGKSDCGSLTALKVWTHVLHLSFSSIIKSCSILSFPRSRTNSCPLACLLNLNIFLMARHSTSPVE